MPLIDPWASEKIENYAEVCREFGISSIDPLMDKIPSPNRYFRRKIIFGHRDYEKILDAIAHKRRFAVMSGFMPSGRIHLGAKMVMEEIIWHQRMGADAHVAIADIEAHSVRGLSWRECEKIGIEEYVLSLIALGFEPKEGSRIYFQSKSRDVKDLAFELSKEVNIAEISAIYGFRGETSMGKAISAIVQSADILAPQLPRFGGPKPVVVPVGVDQDPHLRLTRDLSERVREIVIEDHVDFVRVRVKRNRRLLDELEGRLDGNFRRYEMHLDVINADMSELRSICDEIEMENGGIPFLIPSSTYHRHISGLTGGKMSSSVPESCIFLTDDPAVAVEKLMRAKTGGRATQEEHRRLGGIPQECAVYEILLFHLVEDDGEMEEICSECVSGRRTCGECKRYASELLREFLADHQLMREEARRRLGEYGIEH